jgi:hypothetical protein
MDKKFQLSIDIDAHIIEQITPALIKKRIIEDYDGDIHIPLDALEKLQAVLSYILKNDNHFLAILVGHIFESQTNIDNETELGQFFYPKIFEHIALTIGKEMGPEYESFIIDLVNLRVSAAAKNFFNFEKEQSAIGGKAEVNILEMYYNRMKNYYNKLLIRIGGKSPEIDFDEEKAESELISEFLHILLDECLLNIKITGASLKETK